MTYEDFVIEAEASPFTWEIFGYANDLMFEGVNDSDAYAEAIEYGKRLEYEALEWKKQNES